MESYFDGAYRPYSADVPADLVGKEDHIVEQVPGKRTIRLYTNGDAIGVLSQSLGDGVWNVRLLGKGGTVKVKVGGVINTPGKVKAQNGGKAVAAAAGDRSIGIKTAPEDASADGDIVEIIDVIENIPA